MVAPRSSAGRTRAARCDMTIHSATQREQAPATATAAEGGAVTWPLLLPSLATPSIPLPTATEAAVAAAAAVGVGQQLQLQMKGGTAAAPAPLRGTETAEGPPVLAALVLGRHHMSLPYLRMNLTLFLSPTMAVLRVIIEAETVGSTALAARSDLRPLITTTAAVTITNITQILTAAEPAL